MAEGCICPPACELTCKAPTCPRRPMSNADYWAWQEAQAKYAKRSNEQAILTWEEGRHRPVAA